MLRRKPLTTAERQAHEDREQWADGRGRCWGCGKFLVGRYGTAWVERTSEIHEIIGRPKDWHHPANYSFFCCHCHPNGANRRGEALTIGQVLTLKLLLNPQDYDLDWIREHSLKKHWSPDPLPPQCNWLLSDAALRERQT